MRGCKCRDIFSLREIFIFPGILAIATLSPIGLYDFHGQDEEDLPFKKAEILTIIEKQEAQWWTAKNSIGMIGHVPVPYIKVLESAQNSSNINMNGSVSGGSSQVSGHQGHHGHGNVASSNLLMTRDGHSNVGTLKVPDLHMAIMRRPANAYGSEDGERRTESLLLDSVAKKRSPFSDLSPP